MPQKSSHNEHLRLNTYKQDGNNRSIFQVYQLEDRQQTGRLKPVEILLPPVRGKYGLLNTRQIPHTKVYKKKLNKSLITTHNQVVKERQKQRKHKLISCFARMNTNAKVCNNICVCVSVCLFLWFQASSNMVQIASKIQRRYK